MSVMVWKCSQCGALNPASLYTPSAEKIEVLLACATCTSEGRVAIPTLKDVQEAVEMGFIIARAARIMARKIYDPHRDIRLTRRQKRIDDFARFVALRNELARLVAIGRRPHSLLLEMETDLGVAGRLINEPIKMTKPTRHAAMAVLMAGRSALHTALQTIRENEVTRPLPEIRQALYDCHARNIVDMYKATIKTRWGDQVRLIHV